MTARPENRIETHFEEQGSLNAPGWIGRLVRMFFGLWLLWALFSLMTADLSRLLDTTAPTHWTLWASVVLAYALTPYVINIGFTRNWRRLPQYGILAVSAVLIGVDLAVWGTWWAPPLAAFVLVWLAYFSAHLGLSFALSAVIGTPGCEMRSIPHLWTLITSRATKEHYCPGVLDRIDRWERKR